MGAGIMGDIGCFCCGANNPIGLGLKFEMKGDYCSTIFVPKEMHQSFDGVFHGGLISAVLDEVMGKHLELLGLRSFTGRLSVRYRIPIVIGQPVTFTSEMLGRKQRLCKMKASARLADGRVAAEASAEMMLMES